MISLLLKGSQEEVERIIDGGIHRHGRRPAQQPARVADRRFAVLDILIAFAVVAAALHLTETGKRRELVTQWMTFEAGQQLLCQLFQVRGMSEQDPTRVEVLLAACLKAASPPG